MAFVDTLLSDTHARIVMVDRHHRPGACMSRDAVDATRAHLEYSSAKAQRELGWTHPDIDSVWDPIIRREREPMAARQGFLDKLRHPPVVGMPAERS